MSLSLNIVALSKFDPKDILDHKDILNLWNIAGYSAGICYMPEDYFTSEKCTTENNIKRFRKCVDDGHQSVADHAWIEIKLTGASKALAMWLNSLKFYVTSEKSGRYTVMDVDNNELYTEWRKRAEEYFHFRDQNISDASLKKMAQENARMMLDINAPMTTMAYSATLRQWNIIHDWCLNIRRHWERSYKSIILPVFYTKLANELEHLAECIEKLGVLVDGLVDIKHCFPSGIMPPIPDNEVAFHNNFVLENGKLQLSIHDDVMCVKYYATPAMLAQLQRHRRLSVKMDFTTSHLAHIPTPLHTVGDDLDADIALDWNTDISKLLHQGVIPIGVGVPFTCTGSLADVFTVLVERCCGCAQQEIREFACLIRDTFCEQYETIASELDYDTRLLWSPIVNKYRKGTKLTRCSICKCNNPCNWIKKEAINYEARSSIFKNEGV